MTFLIQHKSALHQRLHFPLIKICSHFSRPCGKLKLKLKKRGKYVGQLQSINPSFPQFSSAIRPRGEQHILALRRIGQTMAAMAARKCVPHHKKGRVLLGPREARLQNPLRQHQLLQQQKLVAPHQQHRPRERAPVARLRTPGRGNERRKSAHYRAHTTGSLGLPQSLVQELLSHHQSVRN